MPDLDNSARRSVRATHVGIAGPRRPGTKHAWPQYAFVPNLLITHDEFARLTTRSGFSAQALRSVATKSVSKNYVARLRVDDVPIALVGIHYIARPRDESRRLAPEAQAEAIRGVALELLGQGFLPVILGDFNDFESEPISQDHVESQPISNVLRNPRAMNLATDADLVNAARFVPKAQRFTAFWDMNENGEIDRPQELTAIDHILLVPELAAKVELADIPHHHDPRQVSDHFPVLVLLRLCGAPVPQPVTAIRLVSLLPNPPRKRYQ